MLSKLRSETGSMSSTVTIISLLIFLCAVCCFQFCYFIYEKYTDFKNAPHMASALSLLYTGENFTKKAYEDGKEFKSESLDFISRFMSLNLSVGDKYEVESVSSKKTLLDFEKQYAIYRHNAHPYSFGERRYSDMDVKFTREIETPFHKILNTPKNIKISTSARVSQNYLPLNIVIAIEETRSNVQIFNNRLRPVLLSALSKFQNASSGPHFIKSSLSFIPYSYRVNENNKCVSSIPRGDGLNFNFWNNYFDMATNYDKLAKKEATGFLSEEEELTMSRLALELGLSELSDQFQYKQLAEHYSNFNYDPDSSNTFYYKNKRSKKVYPLYFADYTDSFTYDYVNSMSFEDVEEGISKIQKHTSGQYGSQPLTNFYGQLNKYLETLSIIRNGFFGDEKSCPKENSFFHDSSILSIPSITLPPASDMSKSVYPPAVEALLYFFRKVNTQLYENNPRYVLFLFAPDIPNDNEESIPFDERGLKLLTQVCELFRNYDAYKQGLPVYKLVIVAPNEHSLKPYIDAKCPTKFTNGKFKLDLATIEYDHHDDAELESLLLSYLSQEGSVRRSVFDSNHDINYLPE